jgi:hypothetical protein
MFRTQVRRATKAGPINVNPNLKTLQNLARSGLVSGAKFGVILRRRSLRGEINQRAVQPKRVHNHASPNFL